MPMDPEHRENIRKAMQKYKRTNHNEAGGRRPHITSDDAFRCIYETYLKEGGLGLETFNNEYKRWKRLNVEETK